MRLSLPFAALVTVAFLLGCQEQGSSPVGPDDLEPQFAKGGNGKPDKPGGGGKDEPTWTSADVVAHGGLATLDSNALISTCSAPSGGTNPTLIWPRHDNCAVIEFETGLRLTDDPRLQVITKRGQIVAVIFREQDTIGEEGIQFESERVPIEPPVEFTGGGFVLHIDRNDIPVWQLNGHTGGPRVAVVGVMHMGDVVYR